MARNNKKERPEEVPSLSFRLSDEEVQAAIPTYFKDAYPHRVDEVVKRVQDKQPLYSVLVEIQGEELLKVNDAVQGLNNATHEATQALQNLTDVANEVLARPEEGGDDDQ